MVVEVVVVIVVAVNIVVVVAVVVVVDVVVVVVVVVVDKRKNKSTHSQVAKNRKIDRKLRNCCPNFFFHRNQNRNSLRRPAELRGSPDPDKQWNNSTALSGGSSDPIQGPAAPRPD